VPRDSVASRQATLEYLTITKIGEKGQVTVPRPFRKDLGLRTGAPFAVLRLGDGLVLLPEQQRFERLCEQMGSALTGAGLTPEAILTTLPEARKRVFERHYKKPDSSRKPHADGLAGHARSDEPTANSTVPRLEYPGRRHCFAMGPRQGRLVDVYGTTLQTGPGGGCSR
jgi:AbrB family looped-hinge helix DNA binding protein